MTDCERTALYFDGELPEADHAAALEHLAGCAVCQAELGDWMGIEAALSRGGGAVAATPAGAAPGAMPAARRRRLPWLAGAVAAAAAAVVALWWTGRGPGEPPPIALAEVRAVEPRLTAPAFDRHRPYRVPRDGAARELIPLDALAGLEHRRDAAGLAAAHVLGGDLARARAALDAAPAGAQRDSDRAAIALVAGDPGEALRLADAALAAEPGLAPAHWNRGLALQALDLPLAAAAELDAVAARGEPGWTDEARGRAAALRAPLAGRQRSLAAYRAAAAAMIAGTGPALTADDARRYPGPARRDLFDALAVAGSADQARALSGLAGELDRLAHSDHASRAVAAVAARDFAVRRQFQVAYRALVAGGPDDAGRAQLIADLSRAGAAVSDILAGAILHAPPAGADLEPLGRAIPPGDPWFAIQRARREAQVRTALGDPAGADAALAPARDACRDAAWAMVCAPIDLDLGDQALHAHRFDDAAARLRAARAGFAAVGAPDLEDRTLASGADLERARGRDAVASADLEELRLRGLP